jgi:hypothetical protein
MLITDLVHAFETVYGALMWTSAIAFILLVIFVGRQKSVATEIATRRDRSAPQLVTKTEKKPATDRATTRKAA